LLPEFRRIKRFLQTGIARKTFSEQLEELGRGLLLIGMLPINAVVLFVGLIVTSIRSLINRNRVTTRFVATRKPTILPPEHRGAPNGYWYVLLEGQANKRGELAEAVSAELANRTEFGAKTYEKEVIQWGGHTLKEVRQQIVVEFRRGVVHIGIYRYGEDLYVRWDSHFNSRTWSFQKFAYYNCIGYRFERSPFSWSRPLFEEVPSIYEFAPSISRTTDYDWADLDALEGLVHDIVMREVKSFKERYHIEKEIDFELKKGLGEAGVGVREEPKTKHSPIGWAKGFVRRQ
jgi:hypothetical protein